ncbi:MAG: magnesium transporter CorA family protein [Bacillota bacterium]|nr:magnesium transporter CorA family protein [Bacillota bacterium]
MLKIWYGEGTGTLEERQDIKLNEWVQLIRPTDEELEKVAAATDVPEEVLEMVMDPKASPRIERRQGVVMMVVHVPFEREEMDYYEDSRFVTVPLGIVFAKDQIVTVSNEDLEDLWEPFHGSLAGEFGTFMKTRFTLLLLRQVAENYEDTLDQVDLLLQRLEEQLQKAQRNREIYALLHIEKTAVQYATSLRQMVTLLRRIQTGRYIKLYADDNAHLSETAIELQQAYEAADLYATNTANILDAYANVVQNNLNHILKYLTFFSLLVAVPTTVGTIYGMNVPLPYQEAPWAFTALIVASVLITGIVAGILRWRKLI